jgi:hypothetical protein
MNKTNKNACKGMGQGIVIVMSEHCCAHVCVPLGLVVRYALGHSRIRGPLASHRVRSRGDDRVLLPFLKPIHANEIGNGNASVSVVVRAMVSGAHGVDRDTPQDLE